MSSNITIRPAGITANGKIIALIMTLPVKILKESGIQAGDILNLSWENNTLVGKKLEVRTNKYSITLMPGTPACNREEKE